MIITFLGRTFDTEKETGYGNAIICQDLNKSAESPEIKHMLEFNFKATCKKIPVLIGYEPEYLTEEATVIFNERECRRLGWFVKLPLVVGLPILDEDGKFRHPFEDWNSPEDAEYDNQ